MTRRTATRTTLVTLGLLALAGCVVNLSFEIKRQAAVQTAGASTFTKDVLINLGDVQEIREHKNNIKSFDLDSVEVSVATVNAGSGQKISGTLVLRQTISDASHDVMVGTITDLTVQQGQSVSIRGTPELDAFLLHQLQTPGTFYAVITNGSVTGAVDVVLDLNMHVSIGYDAGIL